MAQGLGEARTHLASSFEELVGEVLCEEGKHEVGTLGVRYELLPEQEATAQELGIWQLLLPWLRREKSSHCRLPASTSLHLLQGLGHQTKLVHAGSPEHPLRTTSLPPDGPLHFLYQKAWVKWQDIWNLLSNTP